MTSIETQDLTLGYGDYVVIDKLNLKIPKGKITVFVGANGCGKSTLLRSLARLLKPKSGDIYLNNKSINAQSNNSIAKQMAILPQTPVAAEGITVFELVKQGRYPHQSWIKQWADKDDEIIRRSLKVTGVEELSHRPVNSLSGGQRQRVWIAMVLCQDSDIILLDEPTTYLDLSHQVEILDLLYRLNREEGKTIIMVLHDLNLACRYADNIVAVSNKGVYNQGTPGEVVTSDFVKSVFNLDCDIIKDPIFNTALCIPHSQSIRPISKKEVIYN